MQQVFNDRRYLIPFRATLLPQIFTDVLVIGGGVAGFRAALAASQAGAEVIVAFKGGIKHSSTYWAQGGIAAVLTESDTFEDHIADTLTAGAGLCDEAVVRTVIEGGPDAIDELVAWGMPFDKTVDGAAQERMSRSGLALGKEGGHSHFRIAHSDGDATGRALAGTLDAVVQSRSNIRRFDHCFVLDLITMDTGENPGNGGRGSRCVGAITHHPKHGLQVIWAGATILASGGAGQVWRESTNPSSATGDGIAMAYRAGAQLQDMAFMQFHPTTLYVAGASRSLITEAVRGEGAHLVDRHGHRFMPDYDERAELAPRDIVSRSILAQTGKTHYTHVYLDARMMGSAGFAQRFPGIAGLLHKFEIDPGRDLIPVHPSAHYMVGGVRADVGGRTSVPGLYACGEASATGLHGANRLASNSLLEGLVLGKAAGLAAVADASTSDGGAARPHKVISDIRPSDRSELDLSDVRSSLRSVMWRHVSIEREGQRLAEVAEMFDFWARYTLDKIFDEQAGWEVQNMLTAGALVTRAAKWRAESRGTHYRRDAEGERDAFAVHDIWQRGVAVPLTSEKAPA